MISIIIPVYNVDKYLGQCVDSILAQTYTDFEIILVDDGSSDHSGAICDEYANKDNRVRVIHQPNAGVSAARNRGIEAANGEWISFVDSDDFVEPEYLERFYTEKDDADLIIQGLEYYDNRNGGFFKQVRVDNCTLGEEGFKEKVAQNDLLRSGYPVAKAYRRELLSDNIRFNTNISFHEDHIFVLEAMNAAKAIRLVDSLAYKYRYYHSSNTLSRKRHSWDKLNEAAEGMLSCLDVMKERFLEEGSTYFKSIYTFAFEPKIDSMYELFKNTMTDEQRKQAYKSIIDKHQIKTKFNPRDKKNKLVKLVISTVPYSVVKLFIKMVIEYQDRNKQ